MLVTRTMKPSVLLLLLSVLLDWTRITLAEEENTESSAQAQASSVEILQQQEQQGLRGARRSHCPSTEQRVCCLDGMEYPNMCTAAHLHDVNPADCARTHFYNPVCCGSSSSSDNHDKAEYFNACQAAAAGRIDCVAGSCPKPCAAAAANGDPPVCCHGTDNYPNLCQAALVLPQVVVETACVPGICPPPTPLPCPADGTVPAKVCCDAGRREFASRCHAAQSGYTNDDCVVGKCPNEPEPLNCPTDYQPVCCHQPRNGFHGFSNLCEAAKEGVDVRDCRMGECPPLTSSSSP